MFVNGNTPDSGIEQSCPCYVKTCSDAGRHMGIRTDGNPGAAFFPIEIQNSPVRTRIRKALEKGLRIQLERLTSFYENIQNFSDFILKKRIPVCTRMLRDSIQRRITEYIIQMGVRIEEVKSSDV